MGVARSVGILVLAVVGASLVIIPLANMVDSQDGVRQACNAAAICTVSGVAALLMGIVCTRIGNPLAGILGAMALRMAPPLLVCLVLAVRENNVDRTVFVFSLLAYYITTLAVETWLTVSANRSANSIGDNR
jgi:hypothetical protein